MDVCARAEAVDATALARPHAGAGGLTALFALTLFLGSALIFLVEPMFAKMVLPLLGGSPAVWNTCVVFFQASMLAGYGYAHLASTRLRVGHQVALHVRLLVAARGDAARRHRRKAGRRRRTASPIPWLLLPAAGRGRRAVLRRRRRRAPLLQRWFAGTDHPSAGDPYFLYAASNLGSILALVAYPLPSSPSWTLRTRQRSLWSIGFLVLTGLTVVCADHDDPVAACASNPEPRALAAEAEAPVTWRCAAPLVGAVLRALQPDARVSRAICRPTSPPFRCCGSCRWRSTCCRSCWRSRRARMSRTPARGAGHAAARPAVLLHDRGGRPSGGGFVLSIPLHLRRSSRCACHLQPARGRRPATRHLTEFYFWIAFGGVLGGLFNTLLAPAARSAGIVEYPIAVLARLPGPAPGRSTVRGTCRVGDSCRRGSSAFPRCGALRLRAGVTLGRLRRVATLLATGCFSFSRRPLRFGLAMRLC